MKACLQNNTKLSNNDSDTFDRFFTMENYTFKGMAKITVINDNLCYEQCRLSMMSVHSQALPFELSEERDSIVLKEQLSSNGKACTPHS